MSTTPDSKTLLDTARGLQPRLVDLRLARQTVEITFQMRGALQASGSDMGDRVEALASQAGKWR